MASDPGDLYEQGKPLSREGLFQLVAEELFCKHQLGPNENKALQMLMQFLRLSPEIARTVVRLCQTKIQTGKLGPARPLDLARLYERLFRAALADGEIDAMETKMLQAVRQLFRIPDALHALLAGKINTSGPVNGPTRVTAPAESAPVTASSPNAIRTAPRPGDTAPEKLVADATASCNAGRLEAAEDVLRRLLELTPAPAELGALYRNALEGCLTAALSCTDKDRPLLIVAMAESLAPKAESLNGWLVFTDLVALALGGLIQAKRWEQCAQVLMRLDRIPKGMMTQTSASQAKAMAAAIEAMLGAKRLDDCWRCHRTLARLVLDEAETRVACANGLAVTVSYLSQMDKLDLARINQLVGGFQKLVENFPDDRDVARLFAASAEHCQILLIRSKNDVALLEYLKAVAATIERHAEDQSMAEGVARSTANCAALRRDVLDEQTKNSSFAVRLVRKFKSPADPVLKDLAAIMAHLMEAGPPSQIITEARNRFERSAGVSVRPTRSVRTARVGSNPALTSAH